MLEKELMELDNKRNLLEAKMNVLNTAKELFNKENGSLMDEIKSIKETHKVLSDDIREKALEIYSVDENKNKNIAHGVKIRLTTQTKYDSKDALEWAKKHDIALSLDTVVFKKISKVLDLDFITEETTPTATIPTNIVIDGE